MNHVLYHEVGGRTFDLDEAVEWGPRERGGRARFEVILSLHDANSPRGRFHLLTVRCWSALCDDADGQFDLQLDLAWPDDERAAAAADRWAERSVALDHRIRRLESLLAAVERQAAAAVVA